ncbi:MAG: alpha-1,2-fucosyltransferase [Candidatus Methanomethyliaceae archaeon]
MNDAELVIDDVTGFKYDKKYRRQYHLDHFNISCRKATPAERLEPFSRVRRRLLKLINRYLPFEKRNYIQQETLDFDPRLLNFRVRGTVFLEGYWQSEDYFKDIEPIIRQDLKIKPPTDEKNLSMAERIKHSVAVAIHVRFFDNIMIEQYMRDYYERAIRFIESRVVDAHYFIFSDQPQNARNLIKLPDERVTLVAHNKGEANAYCDLWLMSLCKHFIIANSTFSWWGAWLSQNNEKIVVAPKLRIEGIGAWGFKGLIPKEWITL